MATLSSSIMRTAAVILTLMLLVGLCACNSTESTVTTTVGGGTTTTVDDDVTTAVGDEVTTTENDEVTTTVKDNTTTVKDTTTTATDVTTTAGKNTTTVGKDKTTTVPKQNQMTTTKKHPWAGGEKTTTTSTTKPAATTTTVDDSTVIKARSYALKDIRDRITIHGRTAEDKSGLFVDHVGAGIEFTAYMEGEVQLTISQTTNGTMTSYYTVWIDGVRQEQRVMANKRSFTKCTIANFDKGGVHTIRVLKQNELGTSISVFKHLSFTGYLMDVAEKRDLYIEFLGDSITSGYGNMMYVNGIGDPNARPVSAVNSDGTRAWAFLAAEKLNARSTIISDSGIGVVYEHGNTAGRRMSNFWKYNSYGRQDLGDFRPTEVPDLMVINLGTNDRWNNITDANMIKGVKDLITQVRTTYKKDIPVVWAAGMMYDAKNDAVKSALNELGGESAGLYFLALTPDGSGGGGHPGPEGHKQNADILANFLTSKHLV